MGTRNHTSSHRGQHDERSCMYKEQGRHSPRSLHGERSRTCGLEIDGSSKVQEASKVRDLVLVGIRNDGNCTVQEAPRREISYCGDRERRKQYSPKSPHTEGSRACGDREQEDSTSLGASKATDIVRVGTGTHSFTSYQGAPAVRGLVCVEKATDCRSGLRVTKIIVQRVTEVTMAVLQSVKEEIEVTAVTRVSLGCHRCDHSQSLALLRGDRDHRRGHNGSDRRHIHG
ncbi:hypothetical protein PoB_006567800 [Plakobranchus ocellatus]|uniref:Uncharacterized protein n=1 Tax=Plakobranchus ocellatus TaxID=259542 RepID=A0AAV4D557_9GAST|nr:hypothetical protein PoB_006567800 [Plakobranchus ocellatus]